jgi:hypothetical protein
MPATPSEFEEKEFEASLYNQLESGTHNVWSPGQVFEEYIGIDRALYLRDSLFWRFLGISSPPRGVFLNRFDWEFIWRRRGHRRQMPNFRLNLFLQAKRCYYYKRRPRHLRTLLPLAPCWRFDIDLDQQDVLAKIANKLGNRAIVLYAAPAFYRLLELYAHASRGSILLNTTFPLAEKLQGHHAWYYTAPGGNGVANPEPVRVDGIGLEQLLESTRTELADHGGNASEQLSILDGIIMKTVAENVPDNNPRKSLFSERIRLANATIKDLADVPNATGPFLRVMIFAASFNLDWYVAGM